MKNSFNSILLFFFEIAVGILLLINPIGFTTGIITGAGIILIIIGIVNIVKYFKKDAIEASMGQYLMKGLVALLAGVFCAFKSPWFIATFPALTIIYGIIVLITGISKIQLTADMIRQKSKKWFLAIISAIISISCSVVILNNPFTTTAFLWMFTGITLIVESVIDLITLIVSGKEKKSSNEI